MLLCCPPDLCPLPLVLGWVKRILLCCKAALLVFLEEKLLHLWRAVGVDRASRWLGQEGARGGKQLQPCCLSCPACLIGLVSSLVAAAGRSSCELLWEKLAVLSYSWAADLVLEIPVFSSSHPLSYGRNSKTHSRSLCLTLGVAKFNFACNAEML